LNQTSSITRAVLLAAVPTLCLNVASAHAAPRVTRLTPPSNLFSSNDPNPPIIARFLPGQRFDLQATVVPDAGQTITGAAFNVDGTPAGGNASLGAATASGVPAGAMVTTLRAYSNSRPGIHVLRVSATQSNGATVTAQGNFEIVGIRGSGAGNAAKNVIFYIGDGMGIAHRTAARLMLRGMRQGKANGPLAMDTFPFTGLVMTSSLNSIVTDSSPGAACYSTGNKGNNNQHGVFPDDTTDNFDNPRIESIGEYLHRTQGKSLGIVTTSDVFDATPGAFASHTQARSAGTGIVDQYLDDSGMTGLTVLMGGGRKWFLPASAAGSARTSGTDYVLPDDLVAGWNVKRGALDPERDLITEFQRAGFAYAPDANALRSMGRPDRLLGLFALSNMNVSLDKINGRRGKSTVVNDYGFPDQPMLDEMTDKAIDVLSQDDNGFFLMVEGASIDKQAHNMDSERWIVETIEFDRAIQAGLDFARRHPDTLLVVTADHECGGVNIIGASMVSQGELQGKAAANGGAAQLRTGVVGTYEAAGFPVYPIAEDGYPVTTDVDRRMLIGYAAGADRNEDWLTNPQPLRDSQQPFNGQAPLSNYPNLPTNRDTAGGFMVTGQVADTVAAHTASDIPVSAFGRGAALFTGVMDNTDVFFKVMQAVLGTPGRGNGRP
jgi:alkaline phosphatase